MKNTLITYQSLLPAGAIAALVLSVGALQFTDSFAAPGDPVKFGVYDPDGVFSSRTDVDIEHLFLPWEDVELSTIYEADAYARSRGRVLLVTVEPWTWSPDWRVTPTQLQSRILSGYYDQNMIAICKILNELNSPVTVRWGHEMDDPSGQFTWSRWNPDAYIQAYRRMVDLCRNEAPRVTYMWSPKGEKTMTSYYPGDTYADSIGLSVFGLQKWDNDKFGRDRTFAEILKPGYDRAAAYGKPIVVAELGYVGDTAYVQSWDQAVKQSDPAFPNLTANVYFNQKEVYPWPDGYGLPDWRVTQQVVSN
ncbi:glycoside hydrolase family 26 protein [Mesorhizobium sp. AaZ16]|uniref:glycoside hydrolase family 26 protein n=1 Tax=Mesorhizobium sp. AaZ16 TaxID=3402289 RepID=UPI00374ECBAB